MTTAAEKAIFQFGLLLKDSPLDTRLALPSRGARRRNPTYKRQTPREQRLMRAFLNDTLTGTEVKELVMLDALDLRGKMPPRRGFFRAVLEEIGLMEAEPSK